MGEIIPTGDDHYGMSEPTPDDLHDWLQYDFDLFYEPNEDSPMCVMCGREWGTDQRKDGKYYCSMCWTIWNS